MLLATESQTECIGIEYYFADHTMGVSYLHIADGLRYDIVISSKSPPQLLSAPTHSEYSGWFYVSSSGHPTEAQSVLRRDQGAIDTRKESSQAISTTSLSDEKAIPCYATYNPTQLLELASHNGFLIRNQQNLRTFAILLHLSCPRCRQGGQLHNSRLQISDVPIKSIPQLELNPSRSATGSLDISDVGQKDWDEVSWSTATSGERHNGLAARELTSQQSRQPKPEFSSWLEIDRESQYTDNFSSTEFLLSESSTHFDESSSEFTNEQEDLLDGEKMELRVLNDSFSEHDPSSSDFLDHPGHTMWEWDSGAQRWRRKGGDGEENWYPDNFA